MDWLDLLAVQGTLRSLPQRHSSKASILQPSAFFIVQLSHPYMTTGKTIALTRRTFVGKVMSLLFNWQIRALLFPNKIICILIPLFLHTFSHLSPFLFFNFLATLCSIWDLSSLGRDRTCAPCIGEGNGNPLQWSCLENPRDEGAWWAAVYGVVQSQT